MTPIVYPGHHERRYWLAAMICHRFRAIRAEDGTQAAARRLRKYGFPLPLTLRVLGIEPMYRLPRQETLQRLGARSDGRR